MSGLLKYGARGPEVENLQEALNYHLFDLIPALEVDGKFGDKTHARVLAFQRRRGLDQDGVVGPNTRDALYDFIRNRVHVLGLHGPESLELPRSRTLQLTAGGQDEPVPPFPKLNFPRLQLPFPQPMKPPNFFPIPAADSGRSDVRVRGHRRRAADFHLRFNWRSRTETKAHDL